MDSDGAQINKKLWKRYLNISIKSIAFVLRSLLNLDRFGELFQRVRDHKTEQNACLCRWHTSSSNSHAPLVSRARNPLIFCFPPPGRSGGARRPPRQGFFDIFHHFLCSKMMKYDRYHKKTHEKRWKTCLKWWSICIFMVFSNFCFWLFLLEMIENHQEYENNQKNLFF